MDIKVKCPCGSNYEFTEEPVNGRLRFPISCPNCGTDGTAAANEYIRKFQNAFNGFSKRQKNEAGGEDSADSRSKEARLGAGVIGAFLGGFVGMVIWYLIRRQCGAFFDFRFMMWIVGALAWGVGALAGWGARIAVPAGGFGLAGVAALAAGTAIIGGQYLAGRETVDLKLNQATARVYDGMMDYARQADTATNDAQIIKLLSDYGFSPHDAAAGEKFVLCEDRLVTMFYIVFRDVRQPVAVRARSGPVATSSDDHKFSPEDLAVFRQRELPELRAFLQGEPSKVEFTKSLGDAVRANLSLNTMIVQSWSPYQFLWLFLGVVSAYKIAYNRSEMEDA